MRTALGLIAGLLAGVSGVALFGWLLWWLWKRDEEQEAPAIEIAAGPVSPPIETRSQAMELGDEDDRVEEPDQSEAEEPDEPDDLKRIEGIGPKISGVLYEAGISTYAQLADADEGQLENILREADPRLLRLAKPTTWPEQAALAAAGQWDALEALQGELKGGRRA
jgi:predicted flap endonuclease-1-like 5' DNA nuclease